jgi:hypothetical protein
MSPTRATCSAAGDPGLIAGRLPAVVNPHAPPEGVADDHPARAEDDARRPLGGADGPRGVASVGTYRCTRASGPTAGRPRSGKVPTAGRRAPAQGPRTSSSQRLRRWQRDERVAAGQPALRGRRPSPATSEHLGRRVQPDGGAARRRPPASQPSAAPTKPTRPTSAATGSNFATERVAESNLNLSYRSCSSRARRPNRRARRTPSPPTA